MPDLFSTLAQDTPWEWARKRRVWFTSPARDAVTAVVVAVVMAIVSKFWGVQDWWQQGVIALVVGLIVGVGAPQAETLIWWLKRNSILQEEEIQRLRNERHTIGPNSTPASSTLAMRASQGASISFSRPPRVRTFSWKERGPRPHFEHEYWSSVDIVVSSERKEPARAYIDVRDPDGSVVRRNANIASERVLAHETDIIPEEPYWIPVILRLDEDETTLIDLARGPDILAEGTYIADTAFFAGHYQVPLSAGEWSVSPVLILGDVDHQLELRAEWRTFTVS